MKKTLLCRGRRFFMVGGTLLLIVPWLGCASPERRYEILAFFFDGVPPPIQEVVWDGVEVAEGSELDIPIPSKHKPFAERRCDACHSAERGNRLRIEKIRLCRSCHTGEQFVGTMVHGPVAAGQCYGCHHPHQSKFPHLLLEKGSQICGRCHTPETFERIGEHQADKGDECLECHSPHVADNRYLLRRADGV